MESNLCKYLNLFIWELTENSEWANKFIVVFGYMDTNTSLCHIGPMNFNEYLNEYGPERVSKAGTLSTWHRVTDIDQQCYQTSADIY